MSGGARSTYAAATGFRPIAKLDELPDRRPVPLRGPSGEALCAVRAYGGVLVFADECPHRGHPLSLGRCEGARLRCALHGWEFSLRDGMAESPRAPFGLRVFDSRIRDGFLEVRT